MEDRPPERRRTLPILAVAAFALLQAMGHTQDIRGKSGPVVPRSTSDQRGPGQDDVGTRRLAALLKHYRSAGDIESAARVFEELFPPEAAVDPAAALKTAATFPASAVGGAGDVVKPVTGPEGAHPVFISPESEYNPSADILVPDGGGWMAFSAAEQWAGGGPAAIRVRRSVDRGLTWGETLLLGEGRPLTDPSLRRIAGGMIGVAYVRNWDAADGDIGFARFDGALASAGEFPVALSRADQRNPSLATDNPAYADPYLYIAYAEREGPAGSVKLRVSRDLGASWSRDVTIDSFPWPEGGAAVETALAFDHGAGALHIAYARPHGASTGIAVATSKSFGATWSGPLLLTARDDRSDRSPAIAAANGVVVVAFESRAAGGGSDIGCAHSSDTGRTWTAGESVAATAAPETSPDVRVSVGEGTARFFASYVEAGVRVRLLRSEASIPGAWTSEAAVPESREEIPLASAVILPAPAGSGAAGAGVLWSDARADGDIYFSSATTLGLAELAVIPANRDVPYTEGTTSFSVVKTGEGQVDWTAAVVSGESWLEIRSGASGTNSGTIVVAYEANPYLFSRSGSVRVTPADSDIPSVTVTVTQEEAPPGTLSVIPEEGLVSTGPEGGPFAPSSLPYTLQNVGTTWLEWRASKTQDWTDLSPTSGYLAPGASRTVTVSINAEAEGLAPGTYGDTVSFTNRTNGRGNTTRPVSLTVTAATGALAVTPVTGFASTGPVGGPFSPPSQAYTLENTGRTSLDWTAANAQSWTALSAAAGTLGPRESTTVTVSIGTGADLLPVGEYGDTITFTNTTTGSGTTSRSVTLSVAAPPGILTVSPAEGLTSTGPEGGPFTPENQTYTLENTGGTAIGWAASRTQSWTTLSATSGTLEAGATAAVTVAINSAAAALAVGDYGDTVSFTNTTNGNGDTSRAVALTVTAGPVLIVIPSTRDVGFPAGTTTFEVSNTGGGSMAWTADVVSGAGWLAIQSGASGTDGGTIVAAFAANPSDVPRAGSIRVSAPGAAGSPRDVTVNQAGSSFGLTLGGQRLVEKAWIIQREYARLTVTVDNPAAIPVDAYVIYRRVGGGAEGPVQQVAGSAVTSNPWIANDAFLDPAASYTYRIAALDAGGSVLAQSNEITL